MLFPEKSTTPPDTDRPDPDFYHNALAQIHRDALTDGQSPADSQVQQTAQNIFTSVQSWATSLRNLRTDRTSAFAPPATRTVSAPEPTPLPTHDAHKNSPSTNEPKPDTSRCVSPARPSAPARTAPSRIARASRRNETEELSRRAEKSRQNRAAAGQKASAATQTDSPKPAQHFASDPAGTTPGKHPCTKNQPRKPRNNRTFRPGLLAALCITLMLLIGALGWLCFGYRSCNRVAHRYGAAMYRADAETMYGLYDAEILDALAKKKRFDTVGEFIDSEANRLKNDNDRLFKNTIGPNWKASISTVDVSSVYESNCLAFRSVYQKKYGDRIREVRIVHMTASITGSRGSDTFTDSLVMVRIGLWWYVAEEIFL